MLRPISSITPACSSDVARLPPLITMMSLPGCAFSLRTKSPASPLTSSVSLPDTVFRVLEKT